MKRLSFIASLLALPVYLSLDKDASNVVIDIVGTSGAVIDSVELGALKAGQHAFGWDATGVDTSKVKGFAIRATDSLGQHFHRKGEFVATATGVEGSLVYAASSLLRDEIARNGQASFELDLLPDRSAEHVLAQVRHPRGSRSLSSHLKSRLGLDGIKMGILHERLDKDTMNDPARLATAIKALPAASSTFGSAKTELADVQIST